MVVTLTDRQRDLVLRLLEAEKDRLTKKGDTRVWRSKEVGMATREIADIMFELNRLS